MTKAITYSIFIIICFSCNTNYERVDISGDWQFHDKDSNYIELQITKDSIINCHEMFLHNWVTRYWIEKDTLCFISDYSLNRDSVIKRKIEKTDNDNFLLEMLYWSMDENDTIIEKFNHKITRIDSNEFTMSKIEIWSTIDSTGHRIESSDYMEFEEAFMERKLSYKQKYIWGKK